VGLNRLAPLLHAQKQQRKEQTLLERVSQLTAQYENQIADLRVALTLATQDEKEED
jgi:hypothetical protein